MNQSKQQLQVLIRRETLEQIRKLYDSNPKHKSFSVFIEDILRFYLSEKGVFQ